MFKFLEKQKIWLIYVPLVIYWVVLFIATSIPAPDLPSIGMSDKVAHLTAFYCLSILLTLALLYQRKSKLLFEKAYLIALIICLIYAAIDELHQILIPGRSAELLDWIADGGGTVLGIITIRFFINKFKYQPSF